MNNELKVTLDNIPDNCIENQAVQIESMKIVYSQLPDTNSDRDEYQYLTLETQNSGAGLYINISTEGCNHWSIDDTDELANIINDFKNRLKLNTTKGEDLKTFER